MQTKVLEYIIAIADERSVTRAADRFYLSHPALSRHLRRIESELGAPLFVRTRRGMELTPVGIVFVNDAREILQIERELMRELGDGSSVPKLKRELRDGSGILKGKQ